MGGLWVRSGDGRGGRGERQVAHLGVDCLLCLWREVAGRRERLEERKEATAVRTFDRLERVERAEDCRTEIGQGVERSPDVEMAFDNVENVQDNRGRRRELKEHEEELGVSALVSVRALGDERNG